MKLATLHRWDVSPAEARAIQEQVRTRVVTDGAAPVADVGLVAGVDISVGRAGSAGLAAVVLIDAHSLQPVEQSVVRAEVRFPYVPGLLSFREIPLLVPAFEALRRTPDLVVIDGQGYAHPRRCGLASHLGVLLGLPTIGCAKSRLIGTYDEPGGERGAVSPLCDADEQIGMVLRTRTAVKPVFVSVGHRIDLAAATAWVLRLTNGRRLPEPTRLAHNAAAGAQLAH